MRTYKLYLIKDEVAFHYLGREIMFFQLFKECSTATGDLKNVLTKQIHFITKTIPAGKIKKILKQELGGRNDFRAEGGRFEIRYGNSGSASLEVKDKFLLVEAEGSYEAETIFFEVLRKTESFFLAIDIGNERYGWLRPIKKENRRKRKKFSGQILYNSFLSSTL